jgi:hypothetical protein
MDAVTIRADSSRTHRRPVRARIVRPLLLLAALVAIGAHAAPLDPAARAEIDALLARLDASGCTFNRNGTWYPAADVKPHLLRKLKYLEDRGAVQSTEQFIERAASTSSMSGQPYLVQCGSAAPVSSSAWMLAQLQTLRALRANPTPASTVPRQ